MPTRIGKYEVQFEIGHGAFGRVFRAYDPVTRRTVAIKVMIAENDPDGLARFFLEVQATASLKHKNIVTIYDFNETPPYIVMEFVEGGPWIARPSFAAHCGVLQQAVSLAHVMRLELDIDRGRTTPIDSLLN